jgi:putative sterol carrier protein
MLMSVKFPSPEWVQTLEQKLNSDERYARIAARWEGDMLIVIEPSGQLTEKLYYYFDLWHGTCRKAAVLAGPEDLKPAFVLTATYDNIVKILTRQLDPMTAMMTRKLQVHGSMAMMMRNVPTVLDFVRCCNEITREVL